MIAASSASAAPRVASLDQCADQYVLALSPREQIVGLSLRADDADSRLRDQARGLPLRRVDLESLLAAQPQAVVRSWGGDPALFRALEARGVRVISIGDAHDFDGVRAAIRHVAAGLDRRAAGEALIQDMDMRLARSANAWSGHRAAYLTPAGATAGPGTLVDAILRAAGFRNVETRPGYRLISLEQLALAPPDRVVLGFFDTFQMAGDSWGAGRHAVLRRLANERAVASLPGSLLSCPDVGAALAVEQLARQASR